MCPKKEKICYPKRYVTRKCMLPEKVCYPRRYATRKGMLPEKVCYPKRYVTRKGMSPEKLCTRKAMLPEKLCYPKSYVTRKAMLPEECPLLLVSISLLLGTELLGSILFSLSLNFKQMALYYSPAFFFWLLASCMWSTASGTAVGELPGGGGGSFGRFS